MEDNIVLKLRAKLGISQADLVRYLGVNSPMVISRWENGQRKPMEPMRRLFCHLNELSKSQAVEFLENLQKQRIKKTKK